jgi:ADP-ribosyl-[dinitrogen reductase] hydrolase
MALCLANSLVAQGDFIPYDQLVRYKWWHRFGYMSSTGECFDIGAATSNSLIEFESRQKTFAKKKKIPEKQMDTLSDLDLVNQFNVYCSDAGVAGNGALMRLAPVPLFFYRSPQLAVEYSGLSGQITHGDRKAADACRYYGALIAAALGGYTKKQLLDKNFYSRHIEWFGNMELCKEIRMIAEGSYQKKGGYDDGIRGRGYIVDALEAALWAFWSDKDSFEKGALAAVNLGDDTDTTAAIYGQLAGAYYGYDKLPRRWVKEIYAQKFICNLSKWIAYEGERWQLEATKSSVNLALTSRPDLNQKIPETFTYEQNSNIYPQSNEASAPPIPSSGRRRRRSGDRRQRSEKSGDVNSLTSAEQAAPPVILTTKQQLSYPNERNSHVTYQAQPHEGNNEASSNRSSSNMYSSLTEEPVYLHSSSKNRQKTFQENNQHGSTLRGTVSISSTDELTPLRTTTTNQRVLDKNNRDPISNFNVDSSEKDARSSRKTTVSSGYVPENLVSGQRPSTNKESNKIALDRSQRDYPSVLPENPTRQSRNPFSTSTGSSSNMIQGARISQPRSQRQYDGYNSQGQINTPIGNNTPPSNRAAASSTRSQQPTKPTNLPRSSETSQRNQLSPNVALTRGNGRK